MVVNVARNYYKIRFWGIAKCEAVNRMKKEVKKADHYDYGKKYYNARNYD